MQNSSNNSISIRSLTESSRAFIGDKENSMSFHAAAAAMGFLDKVLRPRYSWILPSSGHYDKTRYAQLMDRFCQALFALHQEGRFSLLPRGVQDAATLRRQIENSLQIRDSHFTSNEYFDQGRLVSASFTTYEVFCLVLAAILDDATYRPLYQLPAQQQLFEQDRSARILTLAVALFEKAGLGITGRCNQGARLTLIGVLNGVYPDPAGGYWFFVEDIISNVQLLLADWIKECISGFSAKSLFIRLNGLPNGASSSALPLNPEIEIPLRDYIVLVRYGESGHFEDESIKPRWIDQLQQRLLERLRTWATGHFLDCESIELEIARTVEEFSYESLIVQTILEEARQVTLFSAWSSLEAHAESLNATGAWLREIEGCAQMVETVLRWVGELSANSALLPNDLSDQQVALLAGLNRLLTLDPIMGCIERWHKALVPHRAKLGPKFSVLLDFAGERAEFSKLLSGAFVSSIDMFWRMDASAFEGIVRGIDRALAKFDQTKMLSSLFWLSVRLASGNPLRQITIGELKLVTDAGALGSLSGLTLVKTKLLINWLEKGVAQDGDLLSLALERLDFPIIAYLLIEVAKGWANGVMDSESRLPGLLGQIKVDERYKAPKENAYDYTEQDAVCLLLEVARTEALDSFFTPLFNALNDGEEDRGREFCEFFVDAVAQLIERKRSKELLQGVLWQFMQFIAAREVDISLFTSLLLSKNFTKEIYRVLTMQLLPLIGRDGLAQREMIILASALGQIGSHDLLLMQTVTRKISFTALVDELKELNANRRYTKIEHACATLLAHILAHTAKGETICEVKPILAALKIAGGRGYLALAAVLMQLSVHHLEDFARVIAQLDAATIDGRGLADGFFSMWGVADETSESVNYKEVHVAFALILSSMIHGSKQAFAQEILEELLDLEDGDAMLAEVCISAGQNYLTPIRSIIHFELANSVFVRENLVEVASRMIEVVQELELYNQNSSVILADLLTYAYPEDDDYTPDILKLLIEADDHALLAGILAYLTQIGSQKNGEIFASMALQKDSFIDDLLMATGHYYPEQMQEVARQFRQIEGFDTALFATRLMHGRSLIYPVDSACIAFAGLLASVDLDFLSSELMPRLQEEAGSELFLVNVLERVAGYVKGYKSRESVYFALAFALDRLNRAQLGEAMDLFRSYDEMSDEAGTLSCALKCACTAYPEAATDIFREFVEVARYEYLACVLVHITQNYPQELEAAFSCLDRAACDYIALFNGAREVVQQLEAGDQFSYHTYIMLTAMLTHMVDALKRGDDLSIRNLSKLIDDSIIMNALNSEILADVLVRMAQNYPLQLLVLLEEQDEHGRNLLLSALVLERVELALSIVHILHDKFNEQMGEMLDRPDAEGHTAREMILSGQDFYGLHEKMAEIVGGAREDVTLSS